MILLSKIQISSHSAAFLQLILPNNIIPFLKKKSKAGELPFVKETQAAKHLMLTTSTTSHYAQAERSLDPRPCNYQDPHHLAHAA
jgi:hypothetical protein